MAQTQMLWKLIMQKRQTHAGLHLHPLLPLHTLSWAFHGFTGINIVPRTSPSINTASFNSVVVEIPLLRPLVFIYPITVQELGGILARMKVPMLLQSKEGDAHKEGNATWRACWSNIWLNYTCPWSAIQETTPDTGWPPACPFHCPHTGGCSCLHCDEPVVCFIALLSSHSKEGGEAGQRGCWREAASVCCNALTLHSAMLWPLRAKAYLLEWGFIVERNSSGASFHTGFCFVTLRCSRALRTSGKTLSKAAAAAAYASLSPLRVLMKLWWHPCIILLSLLPKYS